MPDGARFSNPAAMVAVVEAVPADTVGRERFAVIHEDQIDAIADNEVVALAGSRTTDIALKAIC